MRKRGNEMLRAEIEKTLKEVIAENTMNAVSADDIKSGSNLSEDYGLDSIMVINLILELEDRLGICFEDDDFENIDLFSFDEFLEKLVEKNG